MKKILIGSLLLWVIFLFGEDLRPYRLINADVGTATEIDGERVMKLTGNVHFFYGDTEFYSNTAELYDTQKLTKLRGDVKVYQDSLSLFADIAEYFRLEEKLELKHNVLARVDHQDETFRTFTADSISFYRNENILKAFNNVVVYDQREEVDATCGILHYEMDEGYGYLIRRPEISMQDSLSISAEKIEYFEEFTKIVANFDVITKTNDFNIRSDFLIYFDQSKKAIFLGEPIFDSEFAEAISKEMRVFFVDNKIDRAELEENCEVKFAAKADEPRSNWIKSTQMDFSFNDGKIKICKAQGDVSSLYKQQKSKNKEFIHNRSNAEKMEIEFDNGEVNEILLNDNIDGVYKFRQ